MTGQEIAGHRHSGGEDGLHIDGLTFEYPRSATRPALDGFSAHVPQGAAVALVGPNGAGKSTLCKLLNGILKPHSGTIRLEGQPLFPWKRPGHSVAYSFQNPDDQLFQTTVEKEVAFGPRSLGLSPSEIESAVGWAMELFDLHSFANANPLDLPFALRKRVAMAAVVSTRRKWTVLDEPTVGQDPAYRSRVVNIVNRVVDACSGVVIISHDPEFVFQACDRVVVMAAGKCAWMGSREQYVDRSGDVRFLHLAGRLVKTLHLPASLAANAAMIGCLRGLDHGQARGECKADRHGD